MALKATIYKAELNIADMDRGYYETHALTVAQHPSETPERLMLRLVAFARHASETLAFGKGISDDEEPALWQKNLVDEIEVMIELGQPDEKRIRRAAQRAGEAWIYAYGGPRFADTWWAPMAGGFARFDNLHVLAIDNDTLGALGAMLERSMRLQVTIQDGQLWLNDEKTTLLVEFDTLK
ncbi:YaeQ family protein [Jeongeupia sp. USM3]|uniref:YaeQ family protein n=1 Tax=Jeongeupia sp. USM3 TaxID=1906741 RepID=UPI00089DEBCA|nr:YaeQ family protein [Jeongeupia sp. USM3]AOY01194.1 hypothetical protein BJP62_12525 [Jeongeupia sp. USM3]